MTVLQLGPYPPPHGGVQTNLVAIREHLRRRNIAAPVINLTRHRQRDGDDVFYPRTAMQLVWRLLTIRADILHLHIGGQLTLRLLALCLFCSVLPGRRVVLTFHSGGYPSWAGGNVRPWSLRGLVLRRLDAVIAVNAEIARLFERLGVPRARIHVICPYTPVAVDSGVELSWELHAFRASHSPMLTTVGLLEPEYDLHLQIRSLASIRRTLPGAGLVIVGSGSMHEELRQAIGSDPEGQHILLCGDVPHAVTLRLLSESDVLLRTTLYDGDSVSVREALQLGVPVIATDNGMRPAGVHLIPVSDAAALCAAVTQVLGKLDRHADTACVEDRSLDDILELYSSLSKRRTPGRRASTARSAVP
jgi:glycosyltransferase involved in cell wall biosynthesis